MRLIDADELKEYACLVEGICYYGGCPQYTAVSVDVIDQTQTIDAVPVVRCGNCKWYDSAFYACLKYGICVDHDFFCADGERRE